MNANQQIDQQKVINWVNIRISGNTIDRLETIDNIKKITMNCDFPEPVHIATPTEDILSYRVFYYGNEMGLYIQDSRTEFEKYKVGDTFLTVDTKNLLDLKGDLQINGTIESRPQDIMSLRKQEFMGFLNGNAGIKNEYDLSTRMNIDKEFKPEIDKDENFAAEFAFLGVNDLEALPDETPVYIPTGYAKLDEALGGGFAKKTITVWSGEAGHGKSMTIGRCILNAVNAGYRVAEFSGEMQIKRLYTMRKLQAARVSDIYFREYPQKNGILNDTVSGEIKAWLNDKYYLYDWTNHGYDFEKMEAALLSLIKRKRIDMFVLDNLMSLDIRSMDNEKYEAQKRFIWKLHELALSQDLAIVVVCHPKKLLQQRLYDKYDISGTSDLTNSVDNIIYTYRVMDRFLTAYRNDHGQAYPDTDATNCLQIAKNRFFGESDELIPLYYEPITKNFKNFPGETNSYGWLNERKGGQ